MQVFDERNEGSRDEVAKKIKSLFDCRFPVFRLITTRLFAPSRSWKSLILFNV